MHDARDRASDRAPDRHDAGHHAGHGHTHSHAASTSGWRYTFAIGLNLLVVVVQATIGFHYSSTALLADAGHNASDVAGLLLAGGAAWLMHRQPTETRTYGFGKVGILAALLNSLLLVAVSGVLALEAVNSLLSATTHPPSGTAVMVAAFIAILVNFGSGALLMGGHPADINRKAAMLHLFADGAVSVGVLVAGALILWTGAQWIDPVASLIIVGVILASTWKLLFQSLAMAMDSVPPGVDIASVRAWLEQQQDVSGVHDLHVWPLDPTLVALTVHLVAPPDAQDSLLRTIAEGLEEQFGITHATVQIESVPHHACAELHR